MWRHATSLLALALGVVAAPAGAQDSADSAGAPLWRNMPLLPPGSPDEKSCRKHGCIYVVNLSNHIVSELRYAVRTDKNGKTQWSANQFGPSFDFLANHYMRWLKPEGMTCSLSLSVVVRVDGRRVEQSGAFDTCSNPLMLFYIYDPERRERRGTVTVDPIPTDPTDAESAPAPASKP